MCGSHSGDRKQRPMAGGQGRDAGRPASSRREGEALRKEKDLAVLASSVKAGPYAIADTAGRKIFITGHCEYDADTLRSEYVRDKTAGLPIEIPENYFPGDDDTASPLNTWRSGASLLYSNWLNYYVYQETPYIVESIGDIGR